MSEWYQPKAARPRGPACDAAAEAGLTFEERLRFFGSFLRRPKGMGAVVPSSPGLARALLEQCRLEEARLVVELGPGTGVITAMILERLPEKALLVAMELDGPHARALRRRFPQVAVYHDSAENIRACLAGHGGAPADCVISSLPWANMSEEVQHRIMAAVHESLRPGGMFTTYAYVHAAWLPSARRFRRWLQQGFGHVTTSRVVWGNLPPAMVYRCRRAG